MSDPSSPAPVEVPVSAKVETEAAAAPIATEAMETAAPAVDMAVDASPTENEQAAPDADAAIPDADADADTDTAPLPVPVPVPTTNPSNVQVHLPLEEFAEDLDLRLGRANGNIYQRKPGVDGIHDGQVMVRLKKKRFIVIDYGIVPNEHDLQASAMSPHINVPLGGGVTKCTGKVAGLVDPVDPVAAPTLVACKKIGVPILMYDSEPDQPPSLYLRSGLCFTCQRNLNEKRRTQRKRPSERANHQAAAKVSANAQQSQAAFLAAQQAAGVMGVAGVAFPGVGVGVNMGGVGMNVNVNGIPTATNAANHHPGATTNLPGMQTVRIGGIGTQANLVGAGTTGRVNATPHHRVLMAVTNGHKKIKLAHTNSPLVLAPDAIILNGPPDNHSCKSVRGGHGYAEIGADLNVEVHQSLQSTQSLLHSVSVQQHEQQGIVALTQPPPPTPDEISRTYDQAFYSLSKSLYLLVQWKTSWDAAITSAMQQEAQAQAAQQQQHQHGQGQQQGAPNAAALAVQQQNAAALQAASMANAAATAAIGGMINGIPGSIPVGIPGVPVSATPGGGFLGHGVPVGHGHGHTVGHGVSVAQTVAEPTLAQAVASAAAVAAASQQPQTTKQEEGVVPNHNNSNKEMPPAAAGSAPLDHTVEV